MKCLNMGCLPGFGNDLLICTHKYWKALLRKSGRTLTKNNTYTKLIVLIIIVIAILSCIRVSINISLKATSALG